VGSSKSRNPNTVGLSDPERHVAETREFRGSISRENRGGDYNIVGARSGEGLARGYSPVTKEKDSSARLELTTSVSKRRRAKLQIV
jgi:hypothetical protein